MAELESSTTDQKVPCRLPVLLVAETPDIVKTASIVTFTVPTLAEADTFGARYIVSCSACPRLKVVPNPVTNIDVNTDPADEVIPLPATSIVVGKTPAVEVRATPVTVCAELPVTAGSPIEEVNPIPVTERI